MAQDTPYDYTDDCVPHLISGMSKERFSTYFNACGQKGQVQALQLYMWNAAVSARLQGPIHLLEVTLRNAIHERLSPVYGNAWYDQPMLLSMSERLAIQSAKEHLTSRGEPTTPGKIVAEVSFRFWVGLFTGSYHELWRSHLAKLFSKPKMDRLEVYDALDQLRRLRNRVAHHEPLLKFLIPDDLKRIDVFMRNLSPHMRDWMQWHQRAMDAYGALPESVASF